MRHRVLIFATAYFPLVGGAEIAMKEITDRLPGWQFDLICARIQKGLPDIEKIGNVTVHRVGFGQPIDKYFLPLLGPLLAIRSMRYSDASAGIPILRRDELRATVLWSLMASYGGFASLVYTWIRPKTKLLLTLQEGDPLEHYAKRAGHLQWLHRKIFQRANAVTAISAFLALWAKSMGCKGVLEVIPNGVDYERFAQKISIERRGELRQRYGASNQDTLLITASRLSLKNGIDDLISSLAHLPQSVKLLIAGDGEDRDKLEKLVEEHGLARRVSFFGQYGHDQLPELLQASDIFCRPSLSEGLGNSFLEAMASGIPIIGTPVGGIPDFLKDGETGVFCQPRNPESIAAAVQRIQTESGLRDTLIRNGAALVAERYGWDEIAQKVKRILESLVSKT